MQQLQNASDVDVCAEAVLETVLEVMVTLRERYSRGVPGVKGLTMIQTRALGVLRKRPGASLSWLSEQLALTLSATSRLADSLVAKKLIKRTVPPGNRRSISLHLTPAGTKLLQLKMRHARRELGAHLHSLSADQRAHLTTSMRQLHDTLHAQAAAHGGAGEA
ncbi:MAG TPA: MarR family transcriptional regulator [Phycisphaerae bacterium]|jgi:DNA-binding MarR family transcriptional regulator|nr:MarR family transcriptional regulator [Phycisphaerae bacterium]